MAETADVVVIGGGSTGSSIAWQLAKMGAGRVVLLERHAVSQLKQQELQLESSARITRMRRWRAWPCVHAACI